MISDFCCESCRVFKPLSDAVERVGRNRYRCAPCSARRAIQMHEVRKRRREIAKRAMEQPE